jgi:hypothetical protein
VREESFLVSFEVYGGEEGRGVELMEDVKDK